ncbi:MAG: ABC transporter ATP-binding protein [Carbonactinosporaceae bacterium]
MDDVEEGTPLLEIRDLVVEFETRAGTVRAVDEMSCHVREGETVAILGESGSGKSQTCLAVLGLLPRPAGRIASGEVRFRGADLASLPDRALRRVRGESVSMIFQDPLSALNPVLTVGYQIGEAVRRRRGLGRAAARERAVELMASVRIPDARRRVDDYPHQFSGGMRQRVVIAMALALDPDLIIADEPTTALDVTVQKQIMGLLREIQQRRRMGLILVSHDLGVVADVAERVIVMYAGRVAEAGALRPVYEAPAHPYTRGLMTSVPSMVGTAEALVPIAGAPPDPLDLPGGCPFHPRCPSAAERCRLERPRLREVAPGRFSACHFAEGVLADGPPAG